MTVLLRTILFLMAAIATFGLGWYSVEFPGSAAAWGSSCQLFRDPGNKSFRADILETKYLEAPWRDTPMPAPSLAEMVHHREQYAERDQHSEPEGRSDQHSVHLMLPYYQR